MNSEPTQRAASEKSAAPRTVAVMQPYFIPYTGYFRLFAATDLFVIYDCVQFPRRGWVHRNKLMDASGAQQWVTLPLAKAPQSTLIKDLEFASDAPELLKQRLQPFPALKNVPAAAEPIVEALMQVDSTPLAYIERLLERTAGYLGLHWNVLRSSSLAIPEQFTGQDRILEIIRRVGACSYVNAPGGRELYSQDAFAQAGVELSFLPEYQGPTHSILARVLATEDRASLATEMLEFRAEWASSGEGRC